jgi:hypothetical protein
MMSLTIVCFLLNDIKQNESHILTYTFSEKNTFLNVDRWIKNVLKKLGTFFSCKQNMETRIIQVFNEFSFN